MSKCFWKKGIDRLARCKVAMNLQFVKKNQTHPVSLKCNKVKCNRTNDVCVPFLIYYRYVLHYLLLSLPIKPHTAVPK